MARQYYRKKDPTAQGSHIEWVKMSGQEFYRFIRSPEGRDRYFIEWEDIVIEASHEEYVDWRREKDHSDYLRQQEDAYTILSLYSEAISEHGTGEDVAADPTVNVEEDALLLTDVKYLRAALAQLDAESFRLVYALCLADNCQTERELAEELGLSQNAVHKRKKKILKNLKSLVVKLQKSSQ